MVALEPKSDGGLGDLGIGDWETWGLGDWETWGLGDWEKDEDFV